MFADVQLGWPAAAVAMTPLIISALANTFAAIRADRNAKLAAAAAVAAKVEVLEVKNTLKTSTANTATADANLDAKLDATHGAVMGEIAVVKEQTNGQLTEMKTEAKEMRVELKELRLALEKSHQETADAKDAKPVMQSTEPLEVKIVAPIPDGVQSAGALLRDAPLPGNDPSSPEK